MSNRQILSDHFLLRFLERVKGYDLAVFRAAMERVGGMDVSKERDLVDFIETYSAIDLDAVRAEVMPMISDAIARGARRIKYGGFFIPLRGGCAITIMPDRRSYRTDDGLGHHKGKNSPRPEDPSDGRSASAWRRCRARWCCDRAGKLGDDTEQMTLV